MSSTDATLLNAQQLRQAFDHRFTLPLDDSREDSQEYLGIRVESQPFAIPIKHLVRIEPIRKVVSLAGISQKQVGIAGIQGRLIAVYRLAHLLNLNPKLDNDQWIAVCDRDHPIGYSFQAVDGLQQVSSRNLIHHDADLKMSFLKQTIAEERTYRPIIDVIEVSRSILHCI